MSSEVKMIDDNNQNNEEIPSAPQNETIENESSDLWQQKEKQFQNTLAEYEKIIAQEKEKNASLQKDLQVRTDERDKFKNQVVNLEKELAKKSLQGSKNQDGNTSDMVTKARSVIFEKTKLCKNQEVQIEALTEQVKSLKEIVAITKDMLEIRNMEVKHIQDKLDCMELQFTAEKDRHALIHTKLDRMVKLNVDLKAEYEKQLHLFAELQKAYKKRQEVENTVSQENNSNNEPV